MGAATLIGARLMQYAGACVLFGTPLFFLYGTRFQIEVRVVDRWAWERRVLGIAALVALIGALTWIMAETFQLRGDETDTIGPYAVWTVLSQTRFGLACLIRIVLLMLSLAACIAIRCPNLLCRVEIFLGVAITSSFAWTGHGATQIGKTAGMHLAADLFHLLAAATWIGALLPLTVLAFRARRSGVIADGAALRQGLHAFSAIGLWVVAALALSGVLNSIFLLDLAHWRDVPSSLYGKVLLAKLVLFGAMLALAALNRFRMTPALDRAFERPSSHASAVHAARLALSMESLLAVLLLGAVSVLGTLAPPDSGP